MNLKTRFKQEPTPNLKREFYWRAKYEYSRSIVYKAAVQKTSVPENKIEKVIFADKVDKLVRIDANLAQKVHEYSYKSPEIKAVMTKYNDFTLRTTKITESYLQQGLKSVQAGFVANKIVNYEISQQGAYPNVTALKHIENTSDGLSYNNRVLYSMGLRNNTAMTVLNKVEQQPLSQ